MSNVKEELAVKESIRLFFRLYYGKEPNADELRYYSKKQQLFADIVKASKTNITMTRLPITLVVFCKNNEDSLGLCISSVTDVVSEIVVVDTGSTDNTVEIAKTFGARVYKVGFTDFGAIRTLTAHLARQPWVLGLDSDEIIAPEEVSMLEGLISNDGVMAWGLPRRRWLDLDRCNQTEIEAYPDYQYRLIRNSVNSVYVDRVHERLVTIGNVEKASGPHIEHFQDVFKSGDRLKQRNEFYKTLYALDVADGVVRDVPAVAEVDDKWQK